MKRRDSMMGIMDQDHPLISGRSSKTGISLLQFTNGCVLGGVATKGVYDAVTHTTYIYIHIHIFV